MGVRNKIYVKSSLTVLTVFQTRKGKQMNGLKTEAQKRLEMVGPELEESGNMIVAPSINRVAYSWADCPSIDYFISKNTPCCFLVILR